NVRRRDCDTSGHGDRERLHARSRGCVHRGKCALYDHSDSRFGPLHTAVVRTPDLRRKWQPRHTLACPSNQNRPTTCSRRGPLWLMHWWLRRYLLGALGLLLPCHAERLQRPLEGIRHIHSGRVTSNSSRSASWCHARACNSPDPVSNFCTPV